MGGKKKEPRSFQIKTVDNVTVWISKACLEIPGFVGTPSEHAAMKKKNEVQWSFLGGRKNTRV